MMAAMATVDKPIHFRLSPCKVKDYIGDDIVFGSAPINNGFWICRHIKEVIGAEIYRLRISSDNRNTFPKIFGKRHFCYSGSHYFSCWRVKFKYEGKTYFFFILTAKDKGTCYERNLIDGEKPDYYVNGDIHPVDRAIAGWLKTKLEKLQKIV
jgi:hypothetical protein